MNLKLSITLGIFLLCSLSLFSQTTAPAFIVTNQNDTLYGTGSMSFDQKYCSFRKIDAKDFTFYYPSEIKVFRFIEGKYYASHAIKETNNNVKWYFLEYLVDGEIDLFAISGTFRYFIKKENADFLELNDDIRNLQEIDGGTYLVQDKRYLGYIRAYMADAPQLFNDIDKMRTLNEKDLVKLSVNYHHAVCNEYECVNYTKRLLNVRSKVELVTGVTRHNKYYTPKAGVLFHLPLRGDKIFLKTGILYGDRPYGIKAYNEEEYDYNLKVPVSFQYVFTGNKFKPTIALGWPTGIFLISSLETGFIYSVSKNWEVSVNGSIDGLMMLAVGQHHEMYDNRLGHSLGFGIIYNLGGK